MSDCKNTGFVLEGVCDRDQKFGPLLGKPLLTSPRERMDSGKSEDEDEGLYNPWPYL